MLIVQVYFKLICGELTMIMTFMCQFSKSGNRWQEVHLCGKLI